MSIRKRLVLSNLAMIIFPVILLLLMEVILGLLMFRVFGLETENNLKLFTQIRFIGIVVILIVTNALLTYYVSKTIITPVRRLSAGAKRIAYGELDFKMVPERRDELGELAESFEEMRKKLQEAEELQKKYEENRKELSASISHDLKTPITSIKGYVEGILDGVADTPEKLERYANTAYKKANELDHLVDELFLYSRLNVQRVPFHFEKVDLYAYFEDFLEETTLGTGIKAELFPKEKMEFIVKADREQLNRVLANIIENSLKYMEKEEKRIQVRLTEIGEEIEVNIQDNGQGMRKEKVSRIFDQFYRGEPLNSKNSGTGLGLAIGKKIIEEHGGRITADSELDAGMTISFILKKWKEGEDGENFNY